MEQDNLVNIGAEQQFLGAILIDNTIFGKYQVSSWNFYREAHKVIYNAMNMVRCKGLAIDLVTLHQYLSDTKQLETVGGVAYIMSLSQCVPTAANAKSHAKIIKELSLKRELLRNIETVRIKAQEDADIESLITSLQTDIASLVVLNDNNDNIVDLSKNMVQEFASLVEKAKKKEMGIATGFIDYDRLTGGLFKGDLNILAARPAMGKTAFAVNVVRNLVYKQSKNVLFVSLEMSTEQLHHRLIASMAGVEGTKFRTPSSFTREEWERIRDVCRTSTSGSFVVMDKAGCNPSEIEHKARQLQMTNGLDVIVVDYLQLMSATHAKASDRVAVVSEISRALKVMARELGVTVIALSQLNRGVEARSDKRPMLSDLRDSGSIEQDADSVMFLYRDAYYYKDGDKHSELIVAKNRHGSVRTINLFFDEKTTNFRNFTAEA